MQKSDTLQFDIEISKDFSFKRYYFAFFIFLILGGSLIIFDFEGDIEGEEVGKILDLKNTVKIKYPSQVSWSERKLKLINGSLIYIGKDSKLVMDIQGSIITLDNEESLFSLNKENDNFSFDVKFGSIKVKPRRDNIVINKTKIKKNTEKVIRKNRVFRSPLAAPMKPLVRDNIKKLVIPKPKIKKFNDILWSHNKKRVDIRLTNLNAPINEFQLEISGDRNFVKKNEFILNKNPFGINIKRHGKYYLRLIDKDNFILSSKKVYIEKEKNIEPNYLVYPGDKSEILLDKKNKKVKLIVDQVNPLLKSPPKVTIELSETKDFSKIFFSKPIYQNTVNLNLKKEFSGTKEVFLRLKNSSDNKIYHHSSFSIKFRQNNIINPDKGGELSQQDILASTDNSPIGTGNEVMDTGSATNQEAMTVNEPKEIIKKPAPMLKKRTKIKYFIR